MSNREVPPYMESAAVMWETAVMRYKVAGEREYDLAVSVSETTARRFNARFTTRDETRRARGLYDSTTRFVARVTSNIL